MKSLRERRRRQPRVWLIVLCCLLFVGAGAAAYYYLGQGRTTSPSSGIVRSTTIEKPAQPVSVTSDLLATGNSFWGRYTNDWAMASPEKYAYPFSRLNELQRDQYDAWISGLECPMAAAVTMTSAEMEQNLQFNCSPKYLSEAAKWYTVFTLANNHTDNQGVAGFKETQTHLDEHGIQYFGHYDPTRLDDVCDVIAMPVTVTYDNKTSKKAHLPMAFCGYHGVFQIPPAEAVAQETPYSKYMPVIAMPHMGSEYTPAPDQIKTDFYHSLIDAGADVVLGDHPHWIQSTESYKGHLIVYSMGNFMFDQQDTLEVTRSAAIHMKLSLTASKNPQLANWLKLGDSCKAYHDDCLAQVKQAGLQKLDATYQFGAVGTRDDGHRAHLANAADTASILQRLQWNQTMSQLHSPYASL